jgi:hypothetical protein
VQNIFKLLQSFNMYVFLQLYENGINLIPQYIKFEMRGTCSVKFRESSKIKAYLYRTVIIQHNYQVTSVTHSECMHQQVLTESENMINCHPYSCTESTFVSMTKCSEFKQLKITSHYSNENCCAKHQVQCFKHFQEPHGDAA